MLSEALGLVKGIFRKGPRVFSYFLGPSLLVSLDLGPFQVYLKGQIKGQLIGQVKGQG
jgi:hypothetical protein